MASIRCPVGIAGIDSRQPAAVAIAVVAELLQLMGSLPLGRIGLDTLSGRHRRHRQSPAGRSGH
ncbi:hypothetical protein, partial [Aquitalea magnusonii]|uniref:hypothetical protein n=1 Tax=Aquitalea magnusonii TaxID=332411 RepID=UPI001958C2D6